MDSDYEKKPMTAEQLLETAKLCGCACHHMHVFHSQACCAASCQLVRELEAAAVQRDTSSGAA